MDYFWYAYIFIIGSIIGSFLNVCILRIPRKESIVTGRSHCDNCGSPIKAIHMVPILSFLFLRGKCPNCKTKLSIQYPIVEALTAALFFITVYRYGFTPQSFLLCLVHCILIVAGGIDLHTMEIPDALSYWLLAAGILSLLITPSLWVSKLIGLIILSLPMLLAALCIGGFGGGDIKLCGACGLFLGFQLALVGFLIACIAAACFGIYLLVRKKATKKSIICFGPFLSAGFILSALFGPQLIELYSSLLF